MEKKRKVLLCVTFLIALLPILLQWIDLGPTELVGVRSGLRYLGFEFYIAVGLYYLFLLVEHRRGILLAQCGVLLSYGIVLFMFPKYTNIGSAPNWNLVWNHLAWPFWLAVGAIVVHMVLTYFLVDELK